MARAEQKREVCFEILTQMEQVMQQTPKLWGSSVVGLKQLMSKPFKVLQTPV